MSLSSERLIDICLWPARSQCIYLFTRLELAEHLLSKPCDYKSLAKTIGVREEPLYRLLRAVATMDIVTETEPPTRTLVVRRRWPIEMKESATSPRIGAVHIVVADRRP